MDNHQLNALITKPLVLSKDEVAKALNVRKATVENLHRTHQLRGIKVGKHLRWKPDDVRRFVEQLHSEHGERA